ncbi:LysR substrate-binding domain-containing protein [Paraburkholderia sp.]|uniref:LysR substrate-binding domain-containing protein n=1 Tax=Paraburkholderia sp. TaxID=1926495 RepID=UPI003C7D1ADD
MKRFAAEFDPQPLHLDDEAARGTMFGGLAASGWHTAAITMRLLLSGGPKLATGVPGAGAEIEWKMPTRPGDVLHVESEVADIESTTTHAQRKPSGGIHVDVPTAIDTLVLVPALADFYRAYPDIGIDLDLGNRRTDLVTEGIDCAIRAGEVDEQFLVARQIGSFGFTTCATPAFLDAHGTPASPNQLRDLPIVGMTPSRGGRALSFQFSNNDQKGDLALNHRLVVDDTNAYLAAGLASLGIIQAPTYSVRGAIAAGTLVPLLEDWQPQATPVHVIYAPNR